MTIDKILYCKDINFVYIFTYNCVTSGVSSHIVTAFQLLEARLGHISSKNFRHLGIISGFLQGVRKSSDPSERSLGREIFKENSALVGMARNTSLLRETIINFSLSYSPATHLLPFFSPGQNLAEARATRVVSRVFRILQAKTRETSTISQFHWLFPFFYKIGYSVGILELKFLGMEICSR